MAIGALLFRPHTDLVLRGDECLDDLNEAPHDVEDECQRDASDQSRKAVLPERCQVVHFKNPLLTRLRASLRADVATTKTKYARNVGHGWSTLVDQDFFSTPTSSAALAANTSY
jgi:hypothetical protein